MSTLNKMKYEAFKYCESILIKEREKSEKMDKKYSDRINEDYTLTEKQFNELQKKKDKCELHTEQLTLGIRLLSETIKLLRYQINMESEE